ncbi:M48 family metallopeptidase [Thermomonospora umbrina]|uniref:Uncharacterized protein n=1 Tax=Thermomonospora umbrina TaxID=111806 RepID=A0A3D9T539_9ACTN|nr:M48 family metallopeptidase [Thermomonospora umbrina]REE98921.1 hypothetical protein DFJ69_4419 [Thermomonospora umbrina]
MMASVPVTVRQAPGLWAAVADVSRRAGVRPPDEIHLIGDPDVTVEEDSVLLGLVGGRRRMSVGLALLHTLGADELLALVAYESARRGARNEERAAQVAIRAAGPETVARATRELWAVREAWESFLNVYVQPGREAGYAPEDVFGGFAAMVDARRPLLGLGEPVRRATALMGDIPLSWGHRLLDPGERMLLGWPDFTTAVMTAELQREADRIYRRIGSVIAGDPGRLSLAHVFDLIAGGPLPLGLIAGALFPDRTRDEAVPLFAGPLATLMRLAAVRSCVAEWRHTWAGPPELVGPDGLPLRLEDLAARALGSPEAAAEACRRLTDLGVVLFAGAGPGRHRSIE